MRNGNDTPNLPPWMSSRRTGWALSTSGLLASILFIYELYALDGPNARPWRIALAVITFILLSASYLCLYRLLRTRSKAETPITGLSETPSWQLLRPAPAASSTARHAADKVRRDAAGFSIIELIFAAALLLVGLLFFSGIFGAAMAKFADANRMRLGKQWAESGMADIAARARRAPSTKARTEPPVWTGLSGMEDRGGGTVIQTNPSCCAFGAVTQQFTEGDFKIEYTPPTWMSAIYVNGPLGNVSMRYGYTWMGVYYNEQDLADTAWNLGMQNNHLEGDRYRLERTGGTFKFWKIRGTSEWVMWTTDVQVGYPASITFWTMYQGTGYANTILHGIMTDPLSLPDGGDLTPSGACVYPYCDVVWQPMRSGASDPPPLALKLGDAAPNGSLQLFYRRFRVTTLDPTTGLREIKMTLATSASAQPFLDRTTRIMSNK